MAVIKWGWVQGPDGTWVNDILGVDKVYLLDEAGRGEGYAIREAKQYKALRMLLDKCEQVNATYSIFECTDEAVRKLLKLAKGAE
jgi:hypothetical protein